MNFLLLFVLVIILISASEGFGMFVGGFGSVSPATDSEQHTADAVRGSVEERLGHPAGQYRAISYTSQVVAGANYLIKIQTDQEQFVHAKIHVPLPYRNEPPHLMNISLNETEDSPLVPI